MFVEFDELYLPLNDRFSNNDHRSVGVCSKQKSAFEIPIANF